jgi:hypothetical protein
MDQRDTSLVKYKVSLQSACTPSHIMEDILQGISLTTTHPGHPTNQDKLSQATRDQNRIGWLAFLQGFISREWQISYENSLPKQARNKEQLSITWAKSLIVATWTYSKQL